MKLYIFLTTSIRHVVVATDDPSKLGSAPNNLWHPVAVVDEADPTRRAWISDESIGVAKEIIEWNGLVQIHPGGVVIDVRGPRFGHFLEDQQESLDVYWGRMRRIGSIGQGCSAFRVQFSDNVAHELHYHPFHDEIVYVVAGSVDQTIGNKAAVLRVGECAVIPRTVVHTARPLAPGTEVIVILSGDGYDYVRVELARSAAA
jgi:quercetin dioxygenase-like cupin family protein